MDSSEMEMKTELDFNQEEIKANKEEIIADMKVWRARIQGKPKL
jgi:hypothetical protein